MVSFAYNANGAMQSKAAGYDLTATSGKATPYTYDAYGNLTSGTDVLGRQTTYTCNALGRLHGAAGHHPWPLTYDFRNNMFTFTNIHSQEIDAMLQPHFSNVRLGIEGFSLAQLFQILMNQPPYRFGALKATEPRPSRRSRLTGSGRSNCDSNSEPII